MGTEEERGLGGACQGRVRGAGARWGRDAEEQGEDERLEEEEREWKKDLDFVSIHPCHPTPHFSYP